MSFRNTCRLARPRTQQFGFSLIQEAVGGHAGGAVP